MSPCWLSALLAPGPWGQSPRRYAWPPGASQPSARRTSRPSWRESRLRPRRLASRAEVGSLRQCEAGEMLDVKTLRIQEIRYYGATGVECTDRAPGMQATALNFLSTKPCNRDVERALCHRAAYPQYRCRFMRRRQRGGSGGKRAAASSTTERMSAPCCVCSQCVRTSSMATYVWRT